MASFDRFGRACPPASSRRHDWRRLLLLLCIPPAVLTLQAWNIWDPMGSLKNWFMDNSTGAWKYTASKVLTGSNMDDAMWATATDGLNKLAGVMAFVTVAAGAYGILRAAATQDIGGVLSAGARTALAWPLTVLCITLAVKGTSLASTMTKSILNTGSLGGSIPGIDKDSLDVFDSGLMTIALCVCVVLGSIVYRFIIALALRLNISAEYFKLVSAVIVAVAIAAPEDLFGLTCDVVIFGGVVNGFIPSRDMCDPGVVVGGARARQEAAARAAIALAEQRATRRLLFTSFKSCDLETAERLRLHIPRIRLRPGVRTCNIEPSSYLEELNLGPKQTSGPTDQSHPSA